MRIPFNRPSIVGNEMRYIAEAVAGGQLSGNGEFTRRCCRWLEAQAGGKAVLTHSCTGALEMAALLLDLGPGDEVIMPSFTFVSTANAFALRGAVPVFVDIRPDTLNLDERLVEAAVTPRCKAIVPVHYAGVGCEMEALLAIAARHRLAVVEDAAHALGARYRGRPLGTLGHLGCYSFHETKNIISGEGGALMVMEPGLAERAEIVSEKGTNRQRFDRGQVDKYAWVELGSSYLPSELVAAFLYAQFEEADAIHARRLHLWQRYRDALAPLAESGRLRLPHVPSHCEHNAHMFYILIENEATRAALIAHLRQAGILAVFHYVPLHTSPMGRKLLAGQPPSLPVTEAIAGRLLRLPMYGALSFDDVDRIVDAIHAFFGR